MAGINLSDQSIAQCCRTDWLPYDLTESKKDIISIFNAEHLKQDRELMLNGTVPKSCTNCVEYEKNGIEIQNYLLASRENIVHTTTQKQTLPPRLDFVLHNFCNLTCVYCGPIFSSSWTKEINDNGTYKSDNVKKTIKIKDLVKNKIPLTEYKKSTSFQILDKLAKHKDFNQVKKITLLGGEPLVNPYLIDVCKTILENNPTVELWITTGLGVPDKTLFNKIEQLKEIDKNNQIGMNVSVETTGKIFEFIRYGITWEDFDRRFRYLIDQFGKDRISIMTVLFVLGMMDYKNFLEYLNSLGLDSKDCQFGYLEDPMYLSLLSFDQNIVKERINDLLATDLLNESTRKTLENTLTQQKANTKLNQQFVEYIQEFSQRRNLDLTIFPKELLEL